MSDEPKRGLPSPEERPDLYDFYDFSSRPLGEPTGIRVPERIQKLIEERQRTEAARKMQVDSTSDSAD